MKELQKIFNGCIVMGDNPFAFGPCENPIMPIIRLSASLLKMGKGRTIPVNITDRFLMDVERRVKKIGELHAKMEAVEDADIKQNYRDMYDFEVESLKESLAVK